MFKRLLDKIKNRRLLVVVLLLFFAVNLFTLYNTFTEKTTSSVWDGKVASKFHAGTGASNDPYIINTGGELAYFFKVINSEDHDEYFNKFYKITNNIDLNGYDFSFAEFDKTFSGNLDGNGYNIFNFKITNFYVDEENETASYTLFDSLYSAHIKNINFSDITFSVSEKSASSYEPEKTTSIGNYSVLKVEEEVEGEGETQVEQPKEEPKVEETKPEDKPTETGNNETGNNETQTETPNENPTTENPTDTPTETPTETQPEEPKVTENNKTDEVKTDDDKKEEVTEDTEENKTDEEENTDETEETTEEEEAVDDEVVSIKINTITVSLFKNVEQSIIENISVNGIKLNYTGNKNKVKSSLFVLNDVDNNTIQNININGTSNINNTNLLIKSYNNANLNNIIYISDNLSLIEDYIIESTDTIYRYKIEDGKLTFYNDYAIKSVVEVFTNNSDLEWKFQNNQFRIVNNGKDDNKPKAGGAKRITRAAPSAHASGVSGNTIYINDYVSDAGYYDGLNHTYSSNGSIPTTADKNLYNDSNLVYVQIHYHGTDYEGDYTGQVSYSESVTDYVYYKVFPISGNYVEFELIDNPYSRRPNGRTFNGWITNYEDAEIRIDLTTYVRYVKVPVTFTNGNPDNISIDVYAVWGVGKTYNYSNSWSNLFSNFDTAGLHPVSTITYEWESVTPYYVTARVNNNTNFPNGAVNVNGTSIAGTRCTTGGGCTYYTHATGNYNANTQYYNLVNSYMQPYTIQQIMNYTNEVAVGDTIAGYFRQKTILNGGSLVGYYNVNGVRQTSGTCTTGGGCTYYELIPFYDDNGDPEVTVAGTMYYYLTTRDTNVGVMTARNTAIWSANENKPFTWTATNNNTNNSTAFYWGINGKTVICYADTRIENMQIYSNVATQNNDTTPTGTGVLYGNNHNLKIGRYVTSTSNTRTVFRFVIGSNITATGSAGSPTTYRLIIESGLYNNLGLSSKSLASRESNVNYYVHATGIFGNDFDRITETDPENTSKMTVRYDLSGAWSGYTRGSSATDVSLTTIIKSGRYGANKYDCYAGVYVGGQIDGKLYSTRKAIIEGGYIYNLIGGPLSDTSLTNINDTYMHMKGGIVDIIVGGAGVAETYGNKVIAVTGGQVNYAVFGGSNGVNGTSNSQGTLDSDTYVYIGGNAVIGKASLVSGNTTESKSKVEAGSVFGIGNGKSGNNYIGTANNSYVVIDGNAQINRNVYGGGNFAATGQDGSGQTYQSQIVIKGGTIAGNVYGGGNNNGATTSNNTTNTTITMTGGTVSGSVYGGFRTKGIVFGGATVNIIGGTVSTNVYGGGEGGYASSSDPGTYVRDNVSVTIGDSNGGPTVNGNVYGGSAFGTVNADTYNAGANNKTVNVVVNNGRVLGSVFGGAQGSSTRTPYVKGNITVDINGGTIGNVYGGFDIAGAPVGTDLVTIDGGTIVNAFGGGNQTSITTTDIRLRGGSVTTLYGGSNQSGAVTTANVTISGGTVGTVFGGNNEGGTCTTTNVSMTNGTVTTAIYGGGNLVNTTTTNVTINGQVANTTIPNIYGGGNQAGATTTNVTLNGSSAKAGNVFGGSNQSGTVTTSHVNATNGTATTVYGGNNAGGSTTTTNVIVTTGTYGTIFGGGNEATSGDTNVTVNGGTINTAIYGGGNKAAAEDTIVTISNTTNTVPKVFGGGNEAGADTATINFTAAAAKAAEVYGGSNTLGDVDESHITITNGVIGTLYGGNNAGGQTDETHITVNNGTITTIFGGGNEATSGDTNVTVNNGTITNIYGGGNEAAVEDTVVEVNGATGTITNIFGGGNQAGATSTSVTVGLNSSSTITATNVYGGSNTLGNVGTSDVVINAGTITNLYGGNNAGGTTTSASVTVNSGTITDLYGGGNVAVTGEAEVLVNAGAITNIFGGGNAAGVTNDTTLTMLGGSVPGNLYGGGNEGTVGGDTNVLIHNASVGGSAYAGGNGSTATVYGNTTITVSGTSVIGSQSCSNLSDCSVFGGGNAAYTGSQATDDSIATVKIKGATIYGNVYGGANTSVVYGETVVNIGADVPAATNVVAGPVTIHGTVFGGGEANASGSDEYDWTFISVTKGVDININGQNYQTFEIDGSIFGSGNASTSAGDSEIMIKNYGTFDNPKHNISIQRTNLVTLDNSAMVLVGATDRENEFSTVLFSLSRIEELDLKNGSTLYLETGANLLEEYKSLDASGNLAVVTINPDTHAITKTADNRIYMFADKKLNIAKDQFVTDYGEVSGMSFFGMYKYDNNNNIFVGIYDDYAYGAQLDWGGVFDNVTSYVLGLHKTNHNIHADGFYTNYIDGETSTNIVDYIQPTPTSGPLYMWTIGESVIEYEVDMTASKFSTLGTYELPLIDFTHPNTSFEVLGFDYTDLEPGIQLIEKTNVPKIATSDANADSIFGFAMETSNSGWLINAQTSFVTDPDNPVIGNTSYVGGNNASAPSVLLYLYHSKNIATDGDMGTVRIQLLAVRQINALEKETTRLIITANLSRVLYNAVDYDAAMTAGRKYELFTSTATNISSSSAISAFFSLFATGDSIYKTGYNRKLVSSVVFPLNTKITMIDFSNGSLEYYYHVINATDVANAQQELANVGEVSYGLSMFEAMGAENSGVLYNDALKNAQYYDSTLEYCEEEFIFIVDFADTTISSNMLNNSLLMELRNANDQTIYSVLANEHGSMIYNIYADKDALIEASGTISSNKIYNGDEFTVDLTIDYTQDSVGSTVIYDTHYFDSKLGIKISLINSDGDVVTGTTLLGLYYEIDEVRYDPNIDGTTRIKIAEKVDDAEKWIKVNTGTSTIPSGHYKLRIETFGSPDGIYYGLESSDYVEFNIEIINEIYGLNVETTAEEMIINSATGNNENGENSITYTITYNSGLNDPNIRMKVYRRNYTTIDDHTYTLVNATNIFTDTLTTTSNSNEYLLVDDPASSNEVTFTLGEDLVSGTYKVEFILYDDNAPIGNVTKYFIIK